MEKMPLIGILRNAARRSQWASTRGGLRLHGQKNERGDARSARNLRFPFIFYMST